DRRLLHRSRADGDAAGRRDAVRGLRLVRLGPADHGRGEAVLPSRDGRADRRAAPVRRRLLGRPLPFAEPGELVRPHPGPEVRLPGDPRRRERAARERDRGSESRALFRAQAPLPADQGRGTGRAVHDADRQGSRSPRGRGPERDHVGRDGVHRRRGRRPAGRGRRLGRDRRPAQRDAVGQGGRARQRAEDLEGARAARGHPHRRLRRGDRRDARRGGVRVAGRTREADRRPRRARPLLAAAREGVHPPGGDGRRRPEGARRVLMATGTAIDVVMPQMGVSVSEGTVTKWLRNEGEAIQADEPLLEISTDKVDTEVPSPGTGILQQILVQEGETVDVGTKLAVIAPEGAPAAAPEEPAPAPAEPEAAEPSEPATAEAAAEADAASSAEAPTPAAAAPAPAATDVSGNGKTFVSPVVARIAAEHGVDVGSVPGTGQGGRVTKKDILAFIERRAPAAPAAPAAPTAPQPAAAPPPPSAPPAPAAPLQAQAGESLEPMNAMRKGIAEHMRRSLDTAAHVTSAIEVDMSKVVAIRERLKTEYQKSYGVNPTYLIFVARAAADTLLQYPWINGEIRGDQIVTRPYVNLGFAVELAEGKGLIVPVVKNAEGLNLLGLARAVTDVAERARNKQLLPDEVQGGTFTITNPGGYGTFHGTPVISQPQSAILGTYAVVKRPWVIQDELGEDVLVIRPIMNLTLTYDHRLIDGALAGRFLRDLREKLQSWGESDY